MMKIGDLVRVRGRSNKDYGLVIKVGKRYFDVLMLGGTWKGEILCEVLCEEDASVWVVL
jgi:hypothetical protein